MNKEGKKMSKGAICSVGLCPFVPCINFPECGHEEEETEKERLKELKEE